MELRHKEYMEAMRDRHRYVQMVKNQDDDLWIARKCSRFNVQSQWIYLTIINILILFNILNLHFKNKNIMTQKGAIKWANEIKAFQEGKQIQRQTRGVWFDEKSPRFEEDVEYRGSNPDQLRTTDY